MLIFEIIEEKVHDYTNLKTTEPLLEDSLLGVQKFFTNPNSNMLSNKSSAKNTFSTECRTRKAPYLNNKAEKLISGANFYNEYPEKLIQDSRPAYHKHKRSHKKQPSMVNKENMKISSDLR